MIDDVNEEVTITSGISDYLGFSAPMTALVITLPPPPLPPIGQFG